MRVALRRGRLELQRASALITSANDALVGNLQPDYWRFEGGINVDGALRAPAVGVAASRGPPALGVPAARSARADSMRTCADSTRWWLTHSNCSSIDLSRGAPLPLAAMPGAPSGTWLAAPPPRDPSSVASGGRSVEMPPHALPLEEPLEIAIWAAVPPRDRSDAQSAVHARLCDFKGTHHQMPQK